MEVYASRTELHALALTAIENVYGLEVHHHYGELAYHAERALLAGEWDVVDAASSGATAASSGLIAAYAQWHTERGIRSLSHVESIR